MKFIHIAAPIACVFTLTACTETSDFIDSSFEDVDASGNFEHSLDPSQNISDEVSAGSDGFAYQVGVLEGEGFVAEVGMLPTTSVSALPTSGSAIYTGIYELAGVEDAFLDDDGDLHGQPIFESGVISLSASFGDGTLTGESNNGNLIVDGTFDGKNLDGSVEYNGIDGDLDGLIGGDRTVGIFHGHDDENIYAGGFIADAN